MPARNRGENMKEVSKLAVARLIQTNGCFMLNLLCTQVSIAQSVMFMTRAIRKLLCQPLARLNHFSHNTRAVKAERGISCAHVSPRSRSKNKLAASALSHDPREDVICCK